MTSPKQKAANRANALKSTGPKSLKGKERVSLNATRHALSVPLDEMSYRPQIRAVLELIRSECKSDEQARELSRRIIDYERNEAYWIEKEINDSQPTKEELAKISLDDSVIVQMSALARLHEQKKNAPITFTTSSRRLTRKERSEEKQFIKDFMSLQRRVRVTESSRAKQKKDTMLRYQRRAMNQLLKGLNGLTGS